VSNVYAIDARITLVSITLVKHPRNARRAPEYSVTHTEAVLFSFGQKQWPRDDVHLVGDSSDAPAQLFEPQPRAAIQHAVLRRHVVEVKRRPARDIARWRVG
jgi:hypothetical protein